MEGILTSWLPSNVPGNNSSDWNNRTGKVDPIYVFTPAGVTAKSVLCLILSTIGSVGFLGNSFIFSFLWKQRSKNPVQSNRFMKNLNLYLRSLSLSDLLSCAVSLPLVCIQVLFDVFQSGWLCKMVRYFQFIFPVITINNLVVISLEKYLSTRTVPRTLSFSTVRKMIICAWILGLVLMLINVAAFDGVRVDLNKTHYTVVCRKVEDSYSFNMTFILVLIVYLLPSIFITCTNVCLLKTLWTRGRRKIGNRVNNLFKADLRAKMIKGTTLLVALTFGFIVPYFFFFGNIVYTQIAKPQRDFATDYLVRCSFAGIAFGISVLNFVIYFAQMKEFRMFLKKHLCRGNNEINQHEAVARERRAHCLAMNRHAVPGTEDMQCERN